MEQEDKDGFITLDETVSDSLICATDSMNDSKRKADDSDSDCVVESVHARKRLCQEVVVESKPADSQIITVIFQSQDIARKYSEEITDYIAELTKSEITTSVERDGKPCLEFYKDQEAGKPDDAQFVGTHQANSSGQDASPQYDQTFTGVVGVQGEVKEKREAKPRNVCFNCEGDHMIAACPEPRDAARITKNRRVHSDKNPIYNRYHEETEQKFGHLVPGQISTGLREALGLRDDDLPLHTYRMRVQGYPPGWLRSARLQRSNISVHHEPTQESDKDTSKSSEKEEDLTYDLTKLMSFPGFNSDHPDGCRDDHKRKGFPAMQSFWSLRDMKARLKRAPTARRTGHTKRPVDLPSSARKDTAQRKNGDKDGDDSGTATTPAEATSNGDEDGSPSLETLEEKRRALLDSLDEPAEEGEVEEAMEAEEEADEEEEDGDNADLVHAPPAASSTPQAPILTPGASRRRELGTPVSAGSAHVVYDAEKWSSGITEHIPYENLPGATGAWDRMSSLMKKVRGELADKN